jgi:peptide deformylase
MAIREILEVPDPRLKQISAPVTKFDDELKTLVADMFETMYEAPGIGLAAVQVGVPIRLLVIDLQPEDEDAEPEVCTAHGGHTHSHRPKFSTPRKTTQSIPRAAFRSPRSTPKSNARPASARAGRTSMARPTRRIWTG